MPIRVQCSRCNAGFNLKDETAGRHFKCPKCGTGIAVPAKGEQLAVTRPASVSPGSTAAPAARRRLWPWLVLTIMVLLLGTGVGGFMVAKSKNWLPGSGLGTSLASAQPTNNSETASDKTKGSALLGKWHGNEGGTTMLLHFIDEQLGVFAMKHAGQSLTQSFDYKTNKHTGAISFTIRRVNADGLDLKMNGQQDGDSLIMSIEGMKDKSTLRRESVLLPRWSLRALPTLQASGPASLLKDWNRNWSFLERENAIGQLQPTRANSPEKVRLAPKAIWRS